MILFSLHRDVLSSPIKQLPLQPAAERRVTRFLQEKRFSLNPESFRNSTKNKDSREEGKKKSCDRLDAMVCFYRMNLLLVRHLLSSLTNCLSCEGRRPTAPQTANAQLRQTLLVLLNSFHHRNSFQPHVDPNSADFCLFPWFLSAL